MSPPTHPPDRVLGDKAYSSRAISSHLRRRRIGADIPEPADQKNNRLRRGSKGGRPPALDTERYTQRNTVERAINKLKAHPGVATRYDKRDYLFRGNHRPRLDQDLAPRPRSVIHGTPPSRSIGPN